MRNKIIALLMGALLYTSLSYASVGVRCADTTVLTPITVDTSNTTEATDLNFKGTHCFSDGSTVTVDDSFSAATSGTIDGVVIGAASPSQLSYLRPITVITNTADTVSAVTAIKSGYLFVLGPTSKPVGGLGMTLTLPTASNGLTYTFTTATSSTLAIRTNTTTDLIYFGDQTTLNTRLTSPASTGSTVTVVGNTNSWYVASMSGNSAGTTGQPWIPGTR